MNASLAPSQHVRHSAPAPKTSPVSPPHRKSSKLSVVAWDRTHWRGWQRCAARTRARRIRRHLQPAPLSRPQSKRASSTAKCLCRRRMPAGGEAVRFLGLRCRMCLPLQRNRHWHQQPKTCSIQIDAARSMLSTSFSPVLDAKLIPFVNSG